MSQITLLFLFPCAIALSIERLSYVWIWRNPSTFGALCERAPWSAPIDPVRAIQTLFYAFKLIQAVVFLAWIATHGQWFSEGEPVFVASEPIALGLGALLLVVGQALNFSVFYRLGRTGTFYGVRFGRNVPWVRGFPFSLLEHPQYVGTVASIWGLFLVTRFPEPDWIVLPLLESVYYILGAHFEQDFEAKAEVESSRAVTEIVRATVLGDGPDVGGSR